MEFINEKMGLRRWDGGLQFGKHRVVSVEQLTLFAGSSGIAKDDVINPKFEYLNPKQ